MNIKSEKIKTSCAGIEATTEDQTIFRSSPYEYLETTEAQCFLTSAGKRIYTQESRLISAPPSVFTPNIPEWMTVAQPKFE